MAPLGFQFESETTFSLSDLILINRRILGSHTPRDPVYQFSRDFWEVGGSIALPGIGFAIDFHPWQFADFLIGFSTVDISNDDYALTRGLDLTDTQSDQLENLITIQENTETIKKYRETLVN